MDSVGWAGRSESLYGSEGWGFESLRARHVNRDHACHTARRRSLTKLKADGGRYRRSERSIWADPTNGTEIEHHELHVQRRVVGRDSHLLLWPLHSPYGADTMKKPSESQSRQVLPPSFTEVPAE